MKAEINKPMILMEKMLLVFLSIRSGHSNNITIAHTPFRPVAFQNPYLVHGTNEKNLQMPTKTLLTQLIPHVLLMEEQV